MKLGDLIRQKRKEAGMTQRALALAVGVNKSAVAQWELYDTRPTNENMAALRRILNISDQVSPPSGEPYLGQIIDDPDELALVMFWRGLDRPERRVVLKLLNIGPGILQAG